MSPLRLELTDYLDPTRWRWVLYDEGGRFLADHDVHLDPTTREYRGFLDLGAYLDYYEPIHPVEAQLAELGAWIGERVFGRLRGALWQHRASPAVAVGVIVPPAADELLLRPFELACFADGTPFSQAGLRFVYQIGQVAGAPEPSRAKRPAREALRLLAAFSLPVGANPLNLRRERYGLQRLVRQITQTQGRAIELHVLQYGATRAILKDALQEGEGWDVVHLSGHGTQGALLLEDRAGGRDVIEAGELGAMLDPARARLKLLILDACYSGAGGQRAARAQLGLDREPMRQPEAEAGDEAPEETEQTALPSLAQALAQRLDCAVLAMRYPVGDAFATDLMLALYDKLLRQRRALPGALHLALDEALEAGVARPPLSPLTPILVGPRAADLTLAPPQRPVGDISLPALGLGIAFPPEPPRFVGRLQPMLRASQALAPGSARRAVLFYGMPGAGKTACALELAYRHAEGRFRGYVWYKAPEEGGEIANELFNVLFEIERQLNAPGLGLTTALDDPRQFRTFTLPRLRALLQQYALLLVLDNLETLLTLEGGWRVPLWGDFMDALLSHGGLSRLVLTSRRCPAGLGDRPTVQVEAVHALSLAESVLLARELPHLGRLFDDEGGRALLRETLRLAQGHPKLLEMADGLAADRTALAERLAAAGDELAGRADVLDAFFALGGRHEGETRQTDADFVRALHDWTARVAGSLSSTAGLLLAFLCRLAPEDRRRDIVEANWQDFLTRLEGEQPAAAAALAQPDGGLPAALRALESAGLVGVERPALDPAQMAGLQGLVAQLAGQAAGATTYSVHPGVAEAARAGAEPAVLDAADVELGDYYVAMFRQALTREMEGGGGAVVATARRAAPYLLRQARWGEAGALLEQMLQRDRSPASLAFALPLLRRVVEATDGSERELIDAVVLAKALGQAGRTAEAEGMLRDLADRAVAQGDYRLASSIAGYLLNVLMSSGRLEEALAAAGEKASYSRQAGLGPWTQLAHETMRLQVLNAMGRYEEVLAEVARLREMMEALPLESEARETDSPWNVRELLLDTGRGAALYSERWEEALALNAELVAFQQARGADALALARTRFNDYSSLLNLARYDKVRELLLECRAVFEAERAARELGVVYGALADLEGRTGDRAAAVRFGEVALGYTYRAGQPEDCAISHNNLANDLARQGADPAGTLAHRLAAATIRLQTLSGLLPTTLQNLAGSDLPPVPPSFEAVTGRVEAVAGVRFRVLFERLPKRAPDGDAAIAAVWQLVAEEKKRVLQEFEPLLQAIAGATGDEGQRAEIKPVLADLEERGWKLSDAAHRIWDGERDAAALSDGLDEQDSALVRRLLELLEA